MSNSILPAGTSRSFGLPDFAIAIVMIMLWGFNIVALKIMVDGLGTLPSALARQAIAAIVCLPFLRIVPGRMSVLMIMGVLSGGLFYLAISASFAVTDNVSALAIASQLGVPFSLILAVIFLKEKIGLPRLAGIALALGGVVLLVFDPEAGKEWRGLLITALASFIWAIGTLLQRGLGGINVFNITGWVALMGTITLLPMALIFDPQGTYALAQAEPRYLLWAVYAAIGSTIGGHGAMVWLLQRHDVATVTPLTLPTPVVSVIFASIWFETPVTPLMILGGLIALSGVTIVALRNARRAREHAAARLREEGFRP